MSLANLKAALLESIPDADFKTVVLDAIEEDEKAQLQEAGLPKEALPKINGRYQHFKGGTYIVEDILVDATSGNSDALTVLYRGAIDGRRWVRSVRDFQAVLHSELASEYTPRFTYLGPVEEPIKKAQDGRVNTLDNRVIVHPEVFEDALKRFPSTDTWMNPTDFADLRKDATVSANDIGYYTVKTNKPDASGWRVRLSTEVPIGTLYACNDSTLPKKLEAGLTRKFRPLDVIYDDL